MYSLLECRKRRQHWRRLLEFGAHQYKLEPSEPPEEEEEEVVAATPEPPEEAVGKPVRD